MKIKTIIGINLIIINIIAILVMNPMNFDTSISIAKAEVATTFIESDDILIDISMNSSAIGPNSDIGFSVELTNNLSQSLYDISANISRVSSDLVITPATDPLFTTSSLDPEASTSFNFSLQYSGGNGPDSVDLALLMDASGSMDEELDSVKAELNSLVTKLSSEIPGIRIGVIVFGSNRYSFYPMSHPNNYIEFTDDFVSLKSFINSWEVGGGTEPWGDALYLANSWSWRENANKLVILLGDEDCDPGMIVGSEYQESDPQGFYNGSDLLDVVINLKNKDVRVSTVLCGGADANTENQFRWISKFTNGTSVYLPDLESEGISLPNIIQEWTLELGREFYREIDLTLAWQDGAGENYTHTQTSSLWIDFSHPSAIVSTTITPTGVDQYSVDFIIDVDDISPIDFVNLYHNAYGSWEVEFLSPIVNTTFYRLELEGVTGGVNLSYIVETSDILRNVDSSPLRWIIVEPKFDVVGEEITIWAESNDRVFSNLDVKQVNSYYFILSGPADIDLITTDIVNLETNETISSSQSMYMNVTSTYRRKIIQYDLDLGKHTVVLSFTENSDNFTMSYSWVTFEIPYSDDFSGSMTDNIRVHGIEWQANNGTFFSFNNEVNSPLVLRAEVFNSKWEYVDVFKVTGYLQIPKNDTYFIIVWATLRTGEFTVRNTVNKPELTTDVYYTTMGPDEYASGTSFPNLLLTLIFVASLSIFIRKRAKKI